MTDLKVSKQKRNGRTWFRMQGDLTRENAGILDRFDDDAREEEFRIDLEGIEAFDSFGAVRLLEIVVSRGGRVSLGNAPADLKAYLLRIPFQALSDEREKRKGSLVASLGDALIRAGTGFRHFLSLAFEFAYWIGVAPFRGRKIYLNRTIHEVHLSGVEALPIVGTIALLMGIILALNAAYQLDKFGAKLFVANLVAVSLTRELGPLITAIIVAGRTGSAIAAELGTMTVTEEIDALKVTGIHPTSFLIVPKLIALCLALPCLVIFADVVGMAGGMGISVAVMDVSLTQYLDQTRSALDGMDVLVGLVKSGVFGLMIGLTGATLGMRLKGGAEDVGRITTAAVVISFFLLILCDLVFTLVFMLLGI